MNKNTKLVIQFLAGFFIFLSAITTQAASPVTTGSKASSALQQALATPTAPESDAKGYVLMDAYTGKILATKNPDVHMAPASLTKMMTSYIVSGAIRAGRVHLNDMVPISKAAWKTGGSKMFIKVGTEVPLKDLMQGMIVDSGNDACVALAEFVAGSEDSFVNLMNQQAAMLGMKNTHFMDVNGLPDQGHYTTPRDMAILARALVLDYPEDYKWYAQKWFTYNNIRQPNRNRLLWRDPTVDGIKTGHTEEAGYCLVASAARKSMRLISVVMGAPTDAARNDDNAKLLTFGFRFYEDRKLASANSSLTQARIWMGEKKEIPAGLMKDYYVTLPANQSRHIKTKIMMNEGVKAPVTKGQSIGTLNVMLNGETIDSTPLVALQDDPQGGLWRRMTDRIAMFFTHQKTEDGGQKTA